jgi:hypothetical protein
MDHFPLRVSTDPENYAIVKLEWSTLATSIRLRRTAILRTLRSDFNQAEITFLYRTSIKFRS